MSKKIANKNVIVPANNQTNVESVNVEKKELTKINLSKFAEKLSNVELKVKKEKETLYKYPDGWTKEKINSEEGKQYRNKLRNRLKSLCNNIFYYAKTEDQNKLIETIAQFDSFYALNYRINDYTVNSVTNSKDQEQNVQLTLDIIKTVKQA